jgi:hypothetical protein
MYLLETTPDLAWTFPTLFAAFIGIAVWIFKKLGDKYVTSIETRLKHGEEEVEEVKRNYNLKFREVHEKIDRTKEVIIDRIDRMNTDQMNWRLQASKDTATIQNDIKHLAETIKHSNDGRNNRS